ncbi:MAG: hypothetical protein MRY21_00395 [Simkaniaceae bacterium]|nr:hypothetical protein [Simkaniaceae bacterium]
MKNIAILLALTLFSCNVKNDREHERHANRLAAQSYKYAKNKYGLRVYGIGGAQLRNIESIAIVYETLKPLKIEEMLEMFTDLTKDLVKRMNSDEKIRPFLANYPADFKNADIGIIYNGAECHRYAENQYIDHIRVVKNNIVAWGRNSLEDSFVVYKKPFPKDEKGSL